MKVVDFEDLEIVCGEYAFHECFCMNLFGCVMLSPLLCCRRVLQATCQKTRIAANPVGINNGIGGANARPENV